MLLLGTGLLAVVFAAIGPYASHAWLKYRLKQHGVVSVFFDPQGNVYWLRLERSSELPEVLQLCDCSHLTSLKLQNEIDSPIVNDGSIPTLKYLDLAHSNLNDRTAAKISGISAKFCYARDTDLTTQGLAAILDRNEFRAVDVRETNITPEEAEAMAQKLGVGIRSDDRWHEFPQPRNKEP